MKRYRWLCILLSAVMVLGVFASCGKKDEGEDNTSDIPTSTDLATAICMKSENYSITGDMFSYFCYKDFYDAMDQYYSYYTGNGLDPTKDLKEQKYGDSDTWFDYFVSLTYQNLANYLTFAEAARAEGTELDDDAKKQVETNLTQLSEAAKEAGKTTEEYIHYLFGDVVTEATVRSCLEFEALANMQYNKISASVTVSDEEIQTYYNENKNSFLYVDYRQVQVRSEYEVACNTDDEKMASAKKKAEYIASSKDITEFVEREVEYLKSVNDPSYNLQLQEALTDEEIQAQATKVTMQYSYTTDTAFGAWAFADGRKAGDMTVLDNGAGIYTAYYLDSAPYRAENSTVNIRLASFDPANFDDNADSAKAAADAAYQAFKATSGTGEDFATVMSEQLGYSAGSLSKNVDLGTLDTYVQPWAFNEERKSGDCEIILSNGVYYIAYFEAFDMQSWEYKAYNSIRANKLSAITDTYYSKYSVSYNLDNIKLLSGVTPYVTEAQTTTTS